MNAKEALKLKVGLFIFLGIFAIVGVIFLLGNERSLFSTHYSLYGDFEDISGLRVGAPVYLAGVNAGQVDRIHFLKAPGNRKVRVKFRLSQKYQDLIREDSTASIKSEGLLGNKIILIGVGGEAGRILKDGESLITTKETSFSDVMAKGEALLDNFNRATDKINSILGTIEGGETQADVSATVKSLRHIFAEIEHGKGMLHNLIYSTGDDDVMKNFSLASRSIRDMSENFREISERIKAGEGSLGGLIEDPTVYYDLKTLLGKANRNKLMKSVIRGTLKAKDEALVGTSKVSVKE